LAIADNLALAAALILNFLATGALAVFDALNRNASYGSGFWATVCRVMK
jgi:hypothetical protein